MTWQRAHKVVFTAAARAHAKYGIDDRDRVDVFAALQRAGIDVIGQPIPKLFGFYMADQAFGGPSVLLNSRMSEATIRHTAAHELGHHVLNHASQVDYDLNELHTGKRPWTAEEREAEAFAAWFLMPRKAANALLARTGRTALAGPRDVYQLALWLGMSYAGVLRQAKNIRMITAAQAATWTKAGSGQPSPGPGLPTPRRIWELGPAADTGRIHVQTGDRLRITDVSGDGLAPDLPPGLEPRGTDALVGEFDVDVTSAFTAPGTIRVTQGWHLAVVPTPSRRGCAQAWPTWAGGNNGATQTEVR